MYVAWQRWLAGDVDPGTGTNWYTWNREQLAKMRNDDGNVTDAWRWGRACPAGAVWVRD